MQKVAKLATVLPFRQRADELICKGVHRDLDDLGRRAQLSAALDRDVCNKEVRKQELR